jgi:hypothetical protein
MVDVADWEVVVSSTPVVPVAVEVAGGVVVVVEVVAGGFAAAY